MLLDPTRTTVAVGIEEGKVEVVEAVLVLDLDAFLPVLGPLQLVQPVAKLVRVADRGRQRQERAIARNQVPFPDLAVVLHQRMHLIKHDPPQPRSERFGRHHQDVKALRHSDQDLAVVDVLPLLRRENALQRHPSVGSGVAFGKPCVDVGSDLVDKRLCRADVHDQPCRIMPEHLLHRIEGNERLPTRCWRVHERRLPPVHSIHQRNLPWVWVEVPDHPAVRFAGGPIKQRRHALQLQRSCLRLGRGCCCCCGGGGAGCSWRRETKRGSVKLRLLVEAERRKRSHKASKDFGPPFATGDCSSKALGRRRWRCWWQCWCRCDPQHCCCIREHLVHVQQCTQLESNSKLRHRGSRGV